MGRSAASDPVLTFMEPAGRPGFAALVVHGWGVHSAQYEPLATAIAARGGLAALLDLPGHGPAPGPRPFSLQATQDSILAALAALDGRLGAPAAIAADSAGAMFTVSLGRRLGTRRTALLAPGVFPRWRHLVSPRAIAELAGLLVGQALPLDGWRLETVSTNRQFLAEHRADPYTMKSSGVRYVLTVVHAVLVAVASASPQIQGDVRIWQGGADQVLQPWGARLLKARLGGRRASLRVVEGASHSLIWDPRSGAEVTAEIADWLAAGFER